MEIITTQNSTRWLVPFRVSKWGWINPLCCFAIGISVYGWELGAATGALLVASLLLHEIGHIAIAKALDVPVHEFGFCFKGAYIRRAYAECRRDNVLISAAGPVVNLLLTIPFYFIPKIGFEVALCNLLLGVLNLLPFPSSDGSRIWLNPAKTKPAASSWLPDAVRP